MMEAELSKQLGYEKCENKGRNSENSCNGYDERNLKTSIGETTIRYHGTGMEEVESTILEKHVTNTNELEQKIIWMYAKGLGFGGGGILYVGVILGAGAGSYGFCMKLVKRIVWIRWPVIAHKKA